MDLSELEGLTKFFGLRNSTWPKFHFKWSLCILILSDFMCLLHSCLLKICHMTQALEVEIISKIHVVLALPGPLYINTGSLLINLCQDLRRKDARIYWSVSGVLTQFGVQNSLELEKWLSG